MQAVTRLTPKSLIFFCGEFFPLPLIQEKQVFSYWLVQEQCGIGTDRPNMSSAVYHGRKSINQIKVAGERMSTVYSLHLSLPRKSVFG